MAEKYTYSINNNFPNHKISLSELIREIQESEIDAIFDYINTNDDVCDIWFEDSLSGAEITILDSLVSVHDGYTPNYDHPNVFSAHNNASLQSFVSAITINFDDVEVIDNLFENNNSEITIKDDCIVKMSYGLSFDNDSNSKKTSLSSWIERNGIEINGTKSFSYYTDKHTISMNPSQFSMQRSDVIRVRSQILSGKVVKTIPYSCRFSIELDRLV